MVGTLSKELSGEIVILCADQLDGVKLKKLAHVIQKIHDNAPTLHLVLDGDSIENIEKLLLKDKAHAGVFPCYQQIEGLHYRALYSEPIYLCCGKDHPFFDRVDSVITKEALAAAQAIHPGIDIDASGREQLQKLNLSAKAYQFDARKAMILSGRYIGYLPQSYIQQELNQGEMRIIQPSALTYQFNLSLVAKKLPREQAKATLLDRAFSQVFNLDV
jgi:DNA-binding transcriptional LysR family regulator